MLNEKFQIICGAFSKFKMFFLSALGFFFISCTPHSVSLDSGSMRVYDEAAFLRSQKLLNDDLHEQKIDTILLPSSRSGNPLSGASGSKVAKKLYESLTVNFRNPNSADRNVRFLKDTVTKDARVEMYAYGFTIEQGSELITVTTLGELDYNFDGINDYIISFRINQKALEYQVNTQRQTNAKAETRTQEMPTREYILLVKNINSDVYFGEILRIHDYIRQSSGFRSEVYKNYNDAKKSMFQEQNVLNFEQGQSQIVFAPSKEDALRNAREERKNITKLVE